MLKESTAPLLEHRHEFYLLIGTAAAALVALLFVAASIGAGLLTRHADGLPADARRSSPRRMRPKVAPCPYSP